MTAEHLSISPHAACPTGLQPAVDVSSSKTSQTQTTQSFTVNAAPDMSRRGRREKVSLSAVRVCGRVRQPRHRPFYELSIASRTFMICCLMTFVASPAFGIKYLSRGRTRRERRKINIMNNKSEILRQPAVRNLMNSTVRKEWTLYIYLFRALLY